MTETVLEVALGYAAAGLPVVPWRSDKKGSLLKGLVWKDKATTDEATIRRWAVLWRKPGALIASVVPAGKCVLDVDAPAKLNGSVLPTGPTRAGGRGTQTWLAGDLPYATKLPNEAGELLGAGHIAILPTPGSRYTWADERRPWDDDLPPVPEWALAEATSERRQPTEDEPIDSRDELVRFVGYYAGLDEVVIYDQLVRMLADGRIVDRMTGAPGWEPWDAEKHFRPLAREFSKKPRPVLSQTLTIRYVRSGAEVGPPRRRRSHVATFR